MNNKTEEVIEKMTDIALEKSSIILQILPCTIFLHW